MKTRNAPWGKIPAWHVFLRIVCAGNSSLSKYNVDGNKDQTILSYIGFIYIYVLIFLFISETLRCNLTEKSNQSWFYVK